MNTDIACDRDSFKAQQTPSVNPSVEIVRTIGALPINPTAKLVAITMRTTRITDSKTLAEITGLSMRVIQKSKTEYATAEDERSEPGFAERSELGESGEPGFANPTNPANQDSLSRERTHARIETPSGLLPTLEVKKDTPPSPKGPGKAECLEAFELYNATALRCGLPQGRSMPPAREKQIRARLKEVGLAGWRQALANIEKSSYLTGSNKDGWRADLKFLLRPDNFHKVFDGGYGNGRHAKAPVAIRMAKTESQIAAENEAMLREYGLHPECNA